MSTDLSADLREFHQFLSTKISAGETEISPEEALDEWRFANRSEEDLAANIAAIREALDDMANGDVGVELAEFDRQFRLRHGLQKET
jgi:hypothetical protein